MALELTGESHFVLQIIRATYVRDILYSLPSHSINYYLNQESSQSMIFSSIVKINLIFHYDVLNFLTKIPALPINQSLSTNFCLVFNTFCLQTGPTMFTKNEFMLTVVNGASLT